MKRVSGKTSLPVYVTRHTADGYTAQYSVPAWMALLAIRLIVLNVLVWSCIGLYVAGKVAFG